MGLSQLGFHTPVGQGDMDTIFPKYRFFPANGGADIEYTGEVKPDAMTLFLKKDLL